MSRPDFGVLHSNTLATEPTIVEKTLKNPWNA